MNWLSNLGRPGVKKAKPAEEKRETPDNLWIKCPLSGDILYRTDLEPAHWVTPAGFHLRIGPEPRFRSLFDDQKWRALPLPKVADDPLRFRGGDMRYAERLRKDRLKTERDDCMEAAYGKIGGVPSIVLVQNFEFMGGSLGMAAGEAFITAAHEAIRRRAALICVTASGGARMQEGILSLMQMPRTTLAIQELKEAGLPYIVILADPTTGGVAASYAMLGDVHIAEPGALIGFTGPRVIEQTIRQKLPEGFQRAEFQLDKGQVDMVIDRRQIKDILGDMLQILMWRRAPHAEDDDIEALVALEAPTPSKALPKPAPPQRKPAAPKPRAKAAE
ncbi:MAG: acetyl-CoA carboxylase carboxyl transferase subunit beta [Alphaproteobacteria bacterium]|nr:acetyl-CoA carboxylase carboxyl transferase subunit beta [Alphaproteobacteria bacterium]